MSARNSLNLKRSQSKIYKPTVDFFRFLKKYKTLDF